MAPPSAAVYGSELNRSNGGSAGEIAFEALADEHGDVAGAGAHFRASPASGSGDRGLCQLADGGHGRIVDLEGRQFASRALEVGRKSVEAQKSVEIFRGRDLMIEAGGCADAIRDRLRGDSRNQ